VKSYTTLPSGADVELPAASDSLATTGFAPGPSVRAATCVYTKCVAIGEDSFVIATPPTVTTGSEAGASAVSKVAVTVTASFTSAGSTVAPSLTEGATVSSTKAPLLVVVALFPARSCTATETE